MLMRHYNTPAKIVETLDIDPQHGVNSVNMAALGRPYSPAGLLGESTAETFKRGHGSQPYADVG